MSNFTMISKWPNLNVNPKTLSSLWETFNAKVGDERYEDTVGPHGLGNRNERGEKLIEWAKSQPSKACQA